MSSIINQETAESITESSPNGQMPDTDTRKNKNSHSNWAVLNKRYQKKCQLDDWQSWQQYLVERKQPESLQTIVSGKKTSPLAWALFADETVDTRTFNLIETLGPVANGTLQKDFDYDDYLSSWLDSCEKRIDETNFVFELLAIAHALPQLANVLPESDWWQLLHLVYQHATDALNATFDDPAPEQLVAGELPLTLAYHFPEINACDELLQPATDVLQEGLIDLTDGEGQIQSDQLATLRPLLACWTRSLALGGKLKKRPFIKEATQQYKWVVRQCVRLTRGDGSQALTSGIPSCYSKHLFNTALELIDSDEDWEAAKKTLPHLKSRTKTESNILPEPAMESEWSRMASLRANWSPGSPKVTVTYPEDQLHVEIETAKEVLISGTWHPIIYVDGEELSPISNWEQIGWMSDTDGDYLELEIHLTNDCRLQRTFFLAREDGFLLVADAVLTSGNSTEIEYRCAAPLSVNTQAVVAKETRELVISKNKSQALVFPLELPEWRIDPRGGELDCDSEDLQLTQICKGTSLYAPLFFDLNPARKRKQYTWRQLTVAEHLEIQPRDQAVGYRVQIGKTNWIFYRSFTGIANRTILGINLTSECLIARIDNEGDPENLLEVEHADS
ncbi:MAG: hypothetical protein COA78_35035 [Blastopirellula sp.]|nr:MAG: hypothetical protein COA78_35035 [Blastopirellula sp.]